MPRISKTHKNRKLDDPASHFDKPSEVVKDGQLSHRQKKEALKTWEQDARAADPEPAIGASATILVAEDNRRLREVVVKQLTSLGLVVLGAKNAQQALERRVRSSNAIQIRSSCSPLVSPASGSPTRKGWAAPCAC